jgi:hypothetical protein
MNTRHASARLPNRSVLALSIAAILCGAPALADTVIGTDTNSVIVQPQ